MADIPPPSYATATCQHSSPGFDLTFVDFIPNCLTPNSLFSKPEYERFDVLLQRANRWLQQNSQYEVKTCESVEFAYNAYNHGLDPESLNYIKYGKGVNFYIRGLRLWLIGSTEVSRSAQQIGCINLVPTVVGPGTGYTPEFESLDTVVTRINNSFKENPLAGNILNVETQEMKFHMYSTQQGVDPDRTSWIEHGNRTILFVYVIRIFYELGNSSNEIIGLADFVPTQLESGGLFNFPAYEPFSLVINRASNWCRQNNAVRFCNAQTLEYKLKHGNMIDTRRMHYVEHGNKATQYVRVLRVAYTQPIVPLDVLPPPFTLSARTFHPTQLSTGGFFSLPKFEGRTQTRDKITTWMRETGARVFSVETIQMRMSSCVENYQGFDTSFTFESNRSELLVTFIRVYLDGVYREPQITNIPRPGQQAPTVQDDCFCNIL